MNELGYHIAEIGNGTDSEFGEVIIVRANPIFERRHGDQVWTRGYKYEEEVFFFPSKKSIMNNLLQIANEEQDWCPVEDEFETRFIFDENEGEKVLVYCHNGLCNENHKDSDTNSQHDESIIGKWYNIHRLGDDPIHRNMFCFSTYLFEQNGKMKKALRLGKSSIDFAENWASIDFRWFTDNDNLHIVDNTSHHEEICKYVVSNGTLHLDSHVYYQTAEDAKENI